MALENFDLKESRPPHGGRGLKFERREQAELTAPSSPARGTWIEIVQTLPVESPCESSPARGTWIEIRIILNRLGFFVVVPRTGDVD